VSRRTRGAIAALAFGLAVGLLLAEGLVRALDLGPTVAPAPVMLESDGKAAGLECYPPGRTEPADFDLADPAALAEAARTTGLTRDELAAVAARTPDCVLFGFNEHTRRDVAFTASERPTVLVLGDSFAEGEGTAQEGTFAARLPALLEPGPEGPVRVLNGARRGNDLPELLDDLDRFAPLVQPDLVLYAMTLNDFEQDPAWAERQAFLNDLILDRQHMGSPDWKLPSPLHLSALAVLIAERGRSRRATRTTVDWYRGMTGPDNPGGWQRTRGDLRAMKQRAEVGGARLLVAVLPLLVGLDGDYPFASVHADVAAACAELGVEHVDLLPALQGRDPATLWVHPVDLHPNGEAHRIIAEALAPEIAARLAP
jgi:lysophospholipase L1-like esterase